MDRFKNEELDKAAKGINPRCTRWIGIKAGSNKRRYICRLCNLQVATESAKWPMTKHAEKAITEHMQAHLED